MKAKLLAMTASMPAPCSAQTACSRELPLPQPSPATTMVAPSFARSAELRPHVVERLLAELGQLGEVAELAGDDGVGVHRVAEALHLRADDARRAAPPARSCRPRCAARRSPARLDRDLDRRRVRCALQDHVAAGRGRRAPAAGAGRSTRISSALAATVAALASQASEPSPMRFSKLRFCELSQTSPLPALRLATPRHIEQPGGSTRKPGALVDLPQPRLAQVLLNHQVAGHDDAPFARGTGAAAAPSASACSSTSAPSASSSSVVVQAPMKHAVQLAARRASSTAKTLSGEKGLATCGARLARSMG